MLHLPLGSALQSILSVVSVTLTAAVLFHGSHTQVSQCSYPFSYLQPLLVMHDLSPRLRRWVVFVGLRLVVFLSQIALQGAQHNLDPWTVLVYFANPLRLHVFERISVIDLQIASA